MKHPNQVVTGGAMPLPQRSKVFIEWSSHVFSFLCFLLLLLAGLSLPAIAQEKKKGIRGLVENEKGEAMEGVSVELKNDSAGIKRSAVTNKSGVFTFENPGVKGPYVFTISHI